MSFFGIVGSRKADGLRSLRQEPAFSLFITIGLANFCCHPSRAWQINDNEILNPLRIVPAAD